MGQWERLRKLEERDHHDDVSPENIPGVILYCIVYVFVVLYFEVESSRCRLRSHPVVALDVHGVAGCDDGAVVSGHDNGLVDEANSASFIRKDIIKLPRYPLLLGHGLERIFPETCVALIGCKRR
jgi:hypothetical protein